MYENPGGREPPAPSADARACIIKIIQIAVYCA